VKKYTGIELMENASVGRAIIRLALPMMVAMIAQSIYNMTDMFFIRQKPETRIWWRRYLWRFRYL
jgi:Na+-driven multidrug efflux pump